MASYHDLSEQQNKKIFNSIRKNKNVVDDLENAIKLSDDVPLQTPEMILIKSIRVNIQEQAKILHTKAKFLNTLDWILFSIGVISAGLTALYFNIQICYQLNLIQLFGITSLVCRLIEGGLAMTKITKNTMIAMLAMEALLRDIVTIEIQFYDPRIDQKALLKDVKTKVEEIWSEFDQLGLKSFIQPDIVDQAATQQVFNFQIEMNPTSNNIKTTGDTSNSINVSVKSDDGFIITSLGK